MHECTLIIGLMCNRCLDSLFKSFLLTGKTIVQANTIKTPTVQPQVQAIVQQQTQMSPVKTPQPVQTHQQIILKQTPQIVQKQGAGIVVGGQVLPQQIVLSTNQIVTNQNGQQVSRHLRMNNVLFVINLVLQVITNQIVCNNQSLAQQLATGKVQVATINGQQVLIRPTGNNQAQVVAQLTTSNVIQQAQVAAAPPAAATPTTPARQVIKSQSDVTSTPTATIQSTPALQQALQSPQKLTTTSTSTVTTNDPNQIDQATMEQLLVGQPPGTVIKCVTAQVIQTPAGPRIVLQGLQGADFTAQQLAAVQQQVKQQLLKGR